MNRSSVTESLFEQLKSHTLVGAKADFARAQALQPALAGFKSAEVVVNALRRPPPFAAETKDGIVAALVVEAQSGKRSLQEVLLQGFLPRLITLRGHGEALIDDRDTLEAMLVAAFAETVAAYPGVEVQPKASQYLFKGTRRRFLAVVRATHDLEAPLIPVGLTVRQPDHEVLPPDSPRETGAPIEAANDPGGYIDEASTLLERLVDGRLPEEGMRLVAATVVHGESVSDYVTRWFPKLKGAARLRTCARLRLQRRKAVRVLRGVLSDGGVSPPAGAS